MQKKIRHPNGFCFSLHLNGLLTAYLPNGLDASGPGGILEIFNGDAKFNVDGSGNFGLYTGTWRFNFNETELVIMTDALPLPVTTKIVELTSGSLKVTTLFPNPVNQAEPIKLRLTFKAR